MTFKDSLDAQVEKFWYLEEISNMEQVVSEKGMCVQCLLIIRRRNKRQPSHSYVISLRFVGRAVNVSDTPALALPIPANIAQETEIAFIESRNDLISLACLCEMSLASL